MICTSELVHKILELQRNFPRNTRKLSNVLILNRWKWVFLFQFNVFSTHSFSIRVCKAAILGKIKAYLSMFSSSS